MAELDVDLCYADASFLHGKGCLNVLYKVILLLNFVVRLHVDNCLYKVDAQTLLTILL